MSDLAATNCSSCGCERNGCGIGGNCIWIILILLCCGNGDSCGNGCGGGLFNSSGGGCDCLIWILLLSCLCGGNGFCG